MAKRPEKPESVPRRDFFRQLFVKAVEKVEEAGREFAQRAKVSFEEPRPAYTPPTWRSSYGYDDYNPHREVYGPPWPPPYGPPVPAKLKAELKAVAERSVSRA